MKTAILRLASLLASLLGLAPCVTVAQGTAPDWILASSFTPPSLTALGKHTYMVRDALTMSFADGTPAIVVPAGFVTDLGSVPKRLRWWEGAPDGSIAPAIVHDYLYWVQPCSQGEADAVLYTAMSTLKVGATKTPAAWRLATHQAMGSAAAATFKKNADSRRNGARRTLTAEYASRLLQTPVDPDETMASLLQKAQAASGLVQQESDSAAVRLTCARVLDKCKACRSETATKKR